MSYEELNTEENVVDNQQPVEQEVVEPTSSKKKKKEKSKARKIIEWVLLGIFLVIFGFLGAGQVDSMIHANDHYGKSIRLGFGSFIVLTNSMEPKYKVNSAIITYRYNADEVIKDFNSGKTIDMTFMDISVGITIEDSEFTEANKAFRSSEGGMRSSPTNEVMTHRLRQVIKLDSGKIVFITSGINTGGVSSKEGQYQVFTDKQYLGCVVVGSEFLGGVFSFISSPWGLLVLLLLPAGYLIVTSSIDIFKVMKESESGNGDNSNKPDALNKLSDADKERLKRELLDEMIEERKKKKDEES